MYQLRYQILIKEQTDYGEFQDAIYYDERPNEDVILIDVQERVDKWISELENPPVVAEPTKEELIKQKAEIEDFILSLESQKQELTDLIATK